MADRAEGIKFARLRHLADSSSGDFVAVLKLVAHQLHAAGIKGKLHVQLLTGKDRWQSATMLLTNGGAEVLKDATAGSDFEILTDPETWNGVIEGKISPIDAMAQRRMRVRGNLQLGSAILKRVVGSEGRTDICRSE
jgi:putative sterol carrier protein